MPYGRRFRRISRVRRVRTFPRRSSRPSRARIPRRTRRSRAFPGRRTQWKNPCPQTVCLNFRYVDNGFDGSTTSAGGFQSFHLFRGNSLYDPDYSGTGVQPYGYDQWVAVLGGTCQYEAYASSITVSYVITSAVANQVSCYVIPTRLPTLPYTDPSDLRVVPYCRWKQTDKTAGLTQKNWVKNYMSIRKLYRETNPRDATFASVYNTNPGYVWYWRVVFDTSNSAQEVNIVYDVKIKYYSRLTTNANVNES